MQDFLNQVNDQFIRIRIEKLKEYIIQQRKQIIHKLNGYTKDIQNIIKNNVSKKSSIQTNQGQSIQKGQQIRKGSESKDFMLLEKEEGVAEEKKLSKTQNQNENDNHLKENCFFMFHKACMNILNIYFPMLMDDQYLTLQSQAQIQQKLEYLSGVVQKSAVNLIRKLSKSKEITITQVKKEETQKSIQCGQNSEQASIQLQQKTKKIGKNTKNSLNKKKKGKNSKIPNQCTFVMQKWLLQNFNDPYPSQQKKQQMAEQSGLTVYQVNNWFINARERAIKKFLKKDHYSNMMNNLRKSSQEESVKKQKKKVSKSHNSQKFIRYGKQDEDYDGDEQ